MRTASSFDVAIAEDGDVERAGDSGDFFQRVAGVHLSARMEREHARAS